MRTFPGGYKKTAFDKKQDELAAKAAEKIQAQHRADLRTIEQAAQRALDEAKLKEAAEAYNKLMDESVSNRKRRKQQRAA